MYVVKYGFFFLKKEKDICLYECFVFVKNKIIIKKFYKYVMILYVVYVKFICSIYKIYM